MKVVAARGDLLDALSVVSRGLSSRSTLPILSSILFQAEKDRLVLQATDLEVSIRHELGVRVEEEGVAVIPGRLLTDVVRSVPEAAITIDASSDDEAVVTCEQGSFTLRTLHADDFPRFPEVDADQTAPLPTKAIEGAVKQVSKAASRDETRPVLTGVLMAVESGHLKMVATDSYRLAVREMTLESPCEDFEVVIPSKAIEEVPKIAAAHEEISIGIAENQVVFEAGDTTYVSRRIEGKFPNYRQLIPSEFQTKATVDKAELLEAAKRIGLFAQHNVPLRTRIGVEDATVTLSATTPDVGEAVEHVMAECEGDDVEIAFNAAFLQEGVASSGSETIALEITSPLKPGVVRSDGDEDFVYIIMPVRIG